MVPLHVQCLRKRCPGWYTVPVLLLLLCAFVLFVPFGFSQLLKPAHATGAVSIYPGMSPNFFWENVVLEHHRSESMVFTLADFLL